MSESIIQVNNITKNYFYHKYDSSDNQGENKPSGNFQLKNISFKLQSGNVLGVFGKNGSGKTTLAKLLSGIIKPTSGEIILRGMVGSVLDIGIGFHPDLNGIENIFINGSLFGYNKSAVKNVINEIISFSELERSIYKPVKFYSNGMYLRLAFSILLHFDIDILILDEIFSVGDLGFKKKSKTKLLEKIKSGLTCIIISHQPEELLSICTDYLHLEEGKIKAYGNSPKILFDYMSEIWRHKPSSLDETEITLINNLIDFKSLKILSTNNSCNELLIEDDFIVSIEMNIIQIINNLNIAIHFYNEQYKPVFTINTVDASFYNDVSLNNITGNITLTTKLKGGWLRPGRYFGTVSFSEGNLNEFRYIPFAATFEIISSNKCKGIENLYENDFLLHPIANWELNQ
jgi:ABC-type polysaccharide/polyol phosphate transport system ATPase subunit